MQLQPGHPGRKWMVFAISVIIAAGSVIYTNTLVKHIDDREREQIELYASTLEYLANESETPNVILLLDEIILSNTTIPVILTDENGMPKEFRNLPLASQETNPEARRKYLNRMIVEMNEQHPPIEITLRVSEEVFGKHYVYYKNSRLLSQLAYYPYVQLSIIAVFVMVIFLLFNYSRRAEQNRVWVGLAKETAHQLGTPLSSLMAWSEYFKSKYPDQQDLFKELDKDIKSLERVTERFSNIGSVPHLKRENVHETLVEIVSYMQSRLSSKINIEMTSFPNTDIWAMLNRPLFAWVIENLLKNAADAMDGKGFIHIRIMRISEGVAIDVMDSGKGMTKRAIRQIFRPGFTTKKRGWGLGLTLAQRIVENYHKGKISVKQSDPQTGTTFRILLMS